MKKITFVMLFLAFTMIAVGCRSDMKDLTAAKLFEFYPGDILNADAVEITDGSTGERRLFQNKQEVKEWVDQVKDIEFVPDPNQEDRDGYLFAVSLFEGQEKKLAFTTNYLGGHYYNHNEGLKNHIQDFFENADSTSND